MTDPPSQAAHSCLLDNRSTCSTKAPSVECLRTESPPLKTCQKCGAQGNFQQIRLIRKGLKRGEKPNQSTWGYKCVNRQCGEHFGASYRFNKETLTYVECQHDGTTLPSAKAAILQIPLEQVVDQSPVESSGGCSEVPCSTVSLSDGIELEQSSSREVIFEALTTTLLLPGSGSNEKEESNILDDAVDANSVDNLKVSLPSCSKYRSRRTQRLSKKSYVPPRLVMGCLSVTEKSDNCETFIKSPLDTKPEIPPDNHPSSKVDASKFGSVNKQSVSAKMSIDSGKDSITKPSLKKLPKGYAYEPIIDPEKVSASEDQSTSHETAMTQYMMFRSKPRTGTYEEGTQTGCDLHKRVIALENIVIDASSPGLTATENMDESVSALLARTLRNSQTIIKEQRAKIDGLEKTKKALLDTLTAVQPFLSQFTQDNKMFLDNVKADVDHMSKELKFFKMECQSEAQCSFNTFKEKQKTMEEVLRYRTAERNKYKAQMDLTKCQLEQSKKSVECLRLDMEDKNLEVREAMKKVEEVEKKLSDSMFIRTNQKCMRCKATESSKKTLIQEVIEAKSEVKKVGKELGANKTKIEELERKNEWMATEMERLHFEHRAYKKDNERLLAENEQFRKGLVPRALQSAIGNMVSEGASDLTQTNGCQAKVGNINVVPEANMVDARSGNESCGAECLSRPDATDSSTNVGPCASERRNRVENQASSCQNSDNRASRQGFKKSPMQAKDNKSSQERDKDTSNRDGSTKLTNGESSRKRPSTVQHRMDNKVFRSSDSERPQPRFGSKTSEQEEKRQPFNDYSRADRYARGRSPPRSQQSSRDRPSSRDHPSFWDRRSPREYAHVRDRSPSREKVSARDRPSSRDCPPSGERAYNWDRLPVWEHVPNRDRPPPVNEQPSGALQPWDRIPCQLLSERVQSPPVFPVHGQLQHPNIYGHANSSGHPFHQSQSGSNRAFVDPGLPWSRNNTANGGFAGRPQDTPFQDPNIRRSFWDRF